MSDMVKVTFKKNPPMKHYVSDNGLKSKEEAKAIEIFASPVGNQASVAEVTAVKAAQMVADFGDSFEIIETKKAASIGANKMVDPDRVNTK